MKKILPILVAAAALGGCADNAPRHAPGPLNITRHGGETDYEVLDAVLFARDSADVGPRAYDVIADIASDARAHRRADVAVEGYTDTTGSHEHNVDLSRARAEAVAGILVRQGIERSRIRTYGFGEAHLAVPTGNGVSESRNRRVVIRILVPR